MKKPTLFHEPGSYDIRTDTFRPPHCCYVYLSPDKWTSPIDDGRRIWKANSLEELTEKLRRALDSGEITKYT